MEATITEWADNTIGGAIVGCLGGGAIGSSGDASTSILTAAIGLLIGALVGSLVKSIKVVYTVQRNGAGWRLMPVTQGPTLHSSPRPAS